MVPASDGQSQRRERAARLKVSLSTSLLSPFPPIKLTKKGHRLPANGETRVAFPPHAQIHVVTLMN